MSVTNLTNGTDLLDQYFSDKSLDGVKKIVRLILNSWPCYQFAIKKSTWRFTNGNKAFPELDNWFSDVLSEHIFKHSDLYTYELSEWIEEILYNEFDTISEDNTLDSTADLLIKMSNWLLGRGKTSVEEAKTKFRGNVEKLLAMNSKKDVVKNVEPSDSSESEDSEDQED
uniref:Pre-rRNA-processing protein TSR2 homolog n=1 Tax=Meloidogyne incognita TaxID=6306 RepID=A0A914MY90_MELIC